MTHPSKRVIIFGCGSNSRHMHKWLNPDERIVAFADNDPAKQGTSLLGYPVLKPSDIREHSFDRILIASHYSDSICDQLINAGIPAKQVQIMNRESLALGSPVKFKLYRKAKALALLFCVQLFCKGK